MTVDRYFPGEIDPRICGSFLVMSDMKVKIADYRRHAAATRASASPPRTYEHTSVAVQP